MRMLLNGFLSETAELFEVHQVKYIENDKPVGSLHHKNFSDNVSVALIRPRFMYIVLYMEDVLIRLNIHNLKEVTTKYRTRLSA